MCAKPCLVAVDSAAAVYFLFQGSEEFGYTLYHIANPTGVNRVIAPTASPARPARKSASMSVVMLPLLFRYDQQVSGIAEFVTAA